MGRWDDYCCICGGTAQIEERLWDGAEEWLIQYQKVTNRSLHFSADAKKSLHLDERDRNFTDTLTLIGPLDENLDPIFHTGVHLVDRPSTPEAAWIVDEGEAVLRYAPSEVRVVEDMEIGGLLLGDIKRRSDGKDYRVNSNIYPFTHARCLRLLYNCTLVKTPQLFWELMRACNGVQWQLQGIRGIDYEEVSDTQGEFIWCYGILSDQKNVDAWMESIFCKEHLDQEDIHKFHMEVAWAWTAPDKFPVEAAIRQQKIFMGQGDSIIRPIIAPVIQLSADVAQLNPTLGKPLDKLPVEITLMIAAHLDLASYVRFSSTSRSVLKFMSYFGNQAVHAILRRTQPWYLPHGSEENEYWDSLLKQSTARDDFPWFAYTKECKTNSPSMRNRRRIWGIMQQLERIAIAKKVIWSF